MITVKDVMTEGQMEAGDLLAVYGTLRRGEGASLEHRSGCVFCDTDLINGTMVSLGGFPGVNNIPDVARNETFNPDDPTVVVDLFVIQDPSLTRMLDAYEGHPDFYYRHKTITATGKTVWVYLYPHEVPSHKAAISSGDWVQWKMQMNAPKYVQNQHVD